MSGNVLVVLDKQSKVGAGSTIAMNGDSIGGFSVSVSGAGNVSARVRLEIANDPGGPWVSDAASIVSLSGICSATTYLRSTTHFEYIRAVVESISVGAVVSVFFGDFASSGTGFYQQDNIVFGETNPLTGGSRFLMSGDVVSGEWVSTPPILKMLISGTGSIVMDCRDANGVVTSSFVSQSFSGAVNEMTYDFCPSETAVAVRFTLSNTVTAKVI